MGLPEQPDDAADRSTPAPDADTPEDRQPARLHLVSQVEDREDPEPEDEQPAARGVGLLGPLMEKLKAEGFEVEGGELDASLRLQLPAGRSQRTVRLIPEAFAPAMKTDFEGWRSLERFDGLWHPKLGLIEVQLRVERMAGQSWLLSRLAGGQSKLGEGAQIRLSDEGSSMEITIGRSSDLMALMAARPWIVKSRFGEGAPGYPRYAPGPLTLQMHGVTASSSRDADDLVERITDALSVDIAMRWGTSLLPVGLMTARSHGRGRRRRTGGQLEFPRTGYPHAPAALYMAGQERTTSTLLRYWAFYQVLEFFFPRYTRRTQLDRMQRILRHPTFDPFDDEDVARAVSAASELENSRIGEEEQLITCLRAITTDHELRQVIADLDLEETLMAKSGGCSRRLVNVKNAHDLVADVARRIYDIRCRIVHSKSDSQREEGHGLLPGTNDEWLVERELPLIEYLAEQALVASASKLQV